MDTIQAIQTRRSIRAYKNKKVPKELINKIIECGLLAPSSKNSQPWKFFVIENKEKIKQIAEILIKSKNTQAEPSDPRTGKIRKGFVASINASGEIMKNAPLLIIIENTCPFSHNRKEVMKSKFSNGINGHDSEFLSLGAAIENISLAVHALGLSTVIIADIIAEEARIKKIFGMKGDLVAVLPIGYPAYKVTAKKEIKASVKFI